MKKKFLIIILIFGIFLLIPKSSLARPYYPEILPGATIGGKTIQEYILYIYKFSFVLGSFLAALMVLIGAFQLMIAAGNPQAIINARDGIIKSLSGLFVLIISFIILTKINPDLIILKELIVRSPPSPEKILIFGNDRGDNVSDSGIAAEWKVERGWEDWIDDPRVEIKPYSPANPNGVCCRAYNPKRKIKPNMIALHYTAGSNDPWYQFNNSGYNEAFVSFIIHKSGHIVQAAPANVRQAGVRAYNGAPAGGINKKKQELPAHYGAAISIEMIGRNENDLLGSPKQIESCIWLVQVLIRKYNLKPCDVWSHEELNDDKIDPGEKVMNLVWDAIGAEKTEMFDHSGDACHNYKRVDASYWTPRQEICPCGNECKLPCINVKDVPYEK